MLSRPAISEEPPQTRASVTLDDPSLYFSRELSWLAFNDRVLEEALDVRNPLQPKEVGYFIPAMTEATEKRCFKMDGKERCTTSIQTNNAETDDRGYIYIVDRANTGMHILELTGEARAAAGLQ